MQAWNIMHTPKQVWEVLLGAYRGSNNPKLLTGVQKALRPFAASITHLPGALALLPCWGIGTDLSFAHCPAKSLPTPFVRLFSE